VEALVVLTAISQDHLQEVQQLQSLWALVVLADQETEEQVNQVLQECLDMRSITHNGKVV
jgi:hypothetical protein